MILTRDNIQSQEANLVEDWLTKRRLLEGYIAWYKAYYRLKRSYIIEPHLVEHYLYDIDYRLTENEIEHILYMSAIDKDYVLAATEMIENNISLLEVADYLDVEYIDDEDLRYSSTYKVFMELLETYNEVKGLTDD